jgi:integrase/recombinase XerD
MTTLREKMKQDMILKGLAELTQKSYLETVTRLYNHYSKSPAKLSNEEVRNYLLHLKKRIWHQIPTTLLFMP